MPRQRYSDQETQRQDRLARASARATLCAQRLLRRIGIINLAARGMLVVSVTRRLGSEGPLLAYCAAPL